MTIQEELKKILDNYEEGDKIYIIKLRDLKDHKEIFSRYNHGFNAHELLGLLTHMQLDILQQMSGEVKPDIIERKVIL
jgi:hypothetical protein